MTQGGCRPVSGCEEIDDIVDVSLNICYSLSVDKYANRLFVEEYGLEQFAYSEVFKE